MKLQFVSDLHLEFPENRAYLAEHPLEVTGDILFVAGDSAYLDLPDSKEDTYSRYVFWDWASEHYQQVIVCFAIMISTGTMTSPPLTTATASRYGQTYMISGN